jgi:hypothetical protein
LTISSSAKKTDRRGEERGELAKKAIAAYQSYIGVKKSSCCFPNIEDRKVAKIATAAYN